MDVASKYKGYTGQLLRVDLTRKKAFEQKLSSEFARMYLGGNGFAARIIYDEVSPDVEPLSPENNLVFMTGPANGTQVPFAAKFGAWSVSPLTGNFHDSMVSSPMASEIKYAGFDGLVFEGRAEKPIFLWIDDNIVEFRDASDLWGMTTTETQEAIREEVRDPEVNVACIGPAGERLVRYAAILVGNRCMGRGGLGAVMGSKKLKAVAIRGSGDVEVADLEGLQRFAKEVCEAVKEHPSYVNMAKYGTPGNVSSFTRLGISIGTRNYREEYFEGWKTISGEFMRENFVMKDLACPTCPLACSKASYVREGPYSGIVTEGPEYETIFAFGSMCGNDRLDVIIKADRLCDEYGIDTITAGSTIAFAMECYEKGIITKEEADGLDLAWGKSDAILKLIDKISKREGFGDLLAEGSLRAARKIGRGAEQYSMTVKGMEIAGHSPRGLRGMMLAYATATRGGSHHDGRATGEYGMDRLSTEGKARFVRDVNHMTAVGDSLIVCRFSERLYGFTLTQMYVDIVNLVTGFGLDLKELELIGERVYNLERAFNVRRGVRRKDDWLPDRILNEPLTTGPAKGVSASPKILNMLLDEYYELRGWDKETGIPTRSKLRELGLGDVARDLEKLRDNQRA
jgi:aldehyde:ferredoxin oxidoreductase